jgi:hypothetical protein
VLQEFVGEVQRSLGYFTNTHRDAQVEYMIGLGSAFKLPGLQKFLADKLSLEVKKADKFNRLTGEGVTDAPVFKENLLSYPVAYGLALQGLGIARLSTNLLPPEITFERKIRDKKPYAVAAAAALLLGTTVLAYGYSIPLSDVSDKKIEEAITKAKGVVGQASTLDKQIADKKTDIDKTQTEVESIVAGQAERKNWIALDRFINESVPVPGPIGKNPVIQGYHNMLEADTYPMWNTLQGQRAIAKLQERVARGVDPTEAGAEDDFREHLATVDIEAVASRFTKDLKGYYTKLEEKGRAELRGGTGRGFPGSDYAPDEWFEKKPDRTGPIPSNAKEELKPEGPGWLFEVRGSTYWKPDSTKQTEEFIMRTVLRNIVRMSRAPTEEQKKLMKPEELKALEEDPIRGKVTHAFLYNVWRDDAPSPGSFKIISSSLINGLLPDEGGGSGGVGGTGEGGMNYGTGPMGIGGRGLPGGERGMGLPGAAGGTTTGGWSPLGSAFGSGSVGGGGGMGMGMGLPPGAGPMIGPGGGGMAVPGPLSPPGGSAISPMPPAVEPAKGTVKVKPRYEFIIVFAWKEPTPSDKLRQIKVKEAAPPPTTGTMGAIAPTPSPTPSKGGSEGESGGLNIRGGGFKDD